MEDDLSAAVDEWWEDLFPSDLPEPDVIVEESNETRVTLLRSPRCC